MVHPLKITNTLADETRFKIYEHLLTYKHAFTVQMIADHFHIHPNVARLHLTKLVDIQVITAEFEKTGKGGRPGRVYRASETGVQLSFPKRDDSILLNILLPLIETFGKEAYEKGRKVAYTAGVQDMKNTLQQHKRTLSFEDQCELLALQSALIGYIPSVTEENQQKVIQFTIFNCPFQNYLAEYATLICELHEAYINGLVKELFGEARPVQTKHMLKDCANCQYEIYLPKK